MIAWNFVTKNDTFIVKDQQNSVADQSYVTVVTKAALRNSTLCLEFVDVFDRVVKLGNFLIFFPSAEIVN